MQTRLFCIKKLHGRHDAIVYTNARILVVVVTYCNICNERTSIASDSAMQMRLLCIKVKQVSGNTTGREQNINKIR